jgi:hypothetical protein
MHERSPKLDRMHAGEDRCGAIAEALGSDAEELYARGSIHSFSMPNKLEAFLVKEVGHFPDVSHRSALHSIFPVEWRSILLLVQIQTLRN